MLGGNTTGDQTQRAVQTLILRQHKHLPYRGRSARAFITEEKENTGVSNTKGTIIFVWFVLPTIHLLN